MLRGFRLALGFMTRIPVRIDGEVKEGELERSIVWFPLIGLLLGCICAAVFRASIIVFPPSVSVLCGMLTLIALTGAFHIDGLADTADGIYSARKREQMLEIMKDSRLGTNGAIAVAFDLAFRFALISSAGHFFNKDMECIFLILPVCGKMVQGIMGYKAVYAREKGLGLFVGTLRGRDVLCCSLSGIAIVTLATGLPGLLASGVVFGLIFLFRRYIEKRLGGITGDVMGAANELAEVFFLMVLSAVQRFV